MPNVTQIIRMRKRQRERAQRDPKSRIGFLTSLIVVLLITLAGMVVVRVYAGFASDLPSIETLSYLLNPQTGLLLNPTTIYDRTGTNILVELENPAIQERQFLTADATQENFLPTTLISATLAIHDPHFWNHPGYQLDGLGENSHNTIAQELVSELLLWDEPPGLQRAIRERLLAAQITASYGRKQILAWYLNSRNFGNMAIGAQAAARVYFGKSASELDLSEAAILSMVIEAPSLNPLDTPDAAWERGQQAIQTMQQEEFISEEQAKVASQAKPETEDAASHSANPAPAFTKYVIAQVSKFIDPAMLERGGFRIVTTLDYDLQFQANCAASMQLRRLADPDGTSVSSDENDCAAGRLLPAILAREHIPASGLAANIIILDTNSGQILTMVGDPSLNMDPASMSGHTPGTLLTPFIYLTSFTRGFSPASLVWDIPSNLSVGEMPASNFHGPQRLRMALANDYLAAAEQVLRQVGSENVWRISRQMGLREAVLPEGDFIASILTQGEASLLEISQAYGVFADQGVLNGWDIYSLSQRIEDKDVLEAVSVLSIDDFSGKIWLDRYTSRSRPVITPQLAYLINNILSDEIARWPSFGHPNDLEIGRPAAVKAGLTSSGMDSWTVGYTPDLVVGVWIGNVDSQPSRQLDAGDSSALWHAIIKYASRDLPTDGWSLPAGISSIVVCDPSGMLPSSQCPSTVTEIFMAGSEPTQEDNLFRSLQINRETNRLATVFTPPELIKTSTFMIVPPEALEWARQVGLPTPPETYDVIPDNLNISDNAQIISPTMFSYVGGSVPILGHVGGSGIQGYRVQVGKGINPQQWTLIGEENTTRGQEGELAVWDTQGLSGLYAIQLLVINEDTQVEKSVIQVTVDNTPPEVRIKYPENEQVFPAKKESILFRVEASDDLGVSSVEFFIDGNRVESLIVPPYVHDWRASPGEHVLTVTASDQAGNTNKTSIQFIVER